MEYFNSQIELVKQKNIEVAIDWLDAGKGYMDAYNHVQKKINKEIDKLSSASAGKISQVSNQAKLFMAVIFLLNFIVSIILAVYLSRVIVTRLKQSLNSIQTIAKGNLTLEPLKVNSKDELSQLGMAINTMQESIKDMILAIMNETEKVHTSSDKTNRNIEKLSANLEEVSATVEELSAGIEETAFSTEEIKTTSSEIEKAVGTIAAKSCCSNNNAYSGHLIRSDKKDGGNSPNSRIIQQYFNNIGANKSPGP